MQLTSSSMNDVLDSEDDFLGETMIEDGDMSNRIAKLSLRGQLMATEQTPLASVAGLNEERLLAQVDRAGAVDTMTAMLFEEDPPGGDVGITSHIHRQITEMQEEYEKPMYVTVGSSAASGGYYVSAPADKIFADPSTLTGSIGVIMQSIN